MIYLLLSVLSSTGIFVIFKSFEKYNINRLHGIVANYFTAFAIGYFTYDGIIFSTQNTTSNWFFAALALGLLFISIFNVMALTTQKNGVSVASVASKMSVIIPVAFGIIVLQERATPIKLLGIVLALIAVFLTASKPRENSKKASLLLPSLLFIGSGIIDTSVYHFEPKGKTALFLSVIFGSAGTIGLLLIIYNTIFKNTKFSLKSVGFGIVLGVINYGSMYYLLKALNTNRFDSSTIFTVNNVAILVASALVGLLVFKEKITFKNWIGITLALVAIILVTVSQNNGI